MGSRIGRWSVVAVAASIAACATGGGAPDPLTLSGQITYRERIALPPGATATVALVELAGADAAVRTISEQHVTSVSQVPIRFTLRFARAAIDTARYYALRARIDDVAGHVLFDTPEPIAVRPAGDVRVEILVRRASGPRAEPAARPRLTTFTCERLRFSIEFPAPGTAWLRLDGDSLVLAQAPAASGARYRDERVEFWNHGNEARVVLDGDTLHCRVALPSTDPWERARAAGVQLRAVGQEPGWSLELTEGTSVVLVTDYGRRREAFLNIERTTGPLGAVSYRAQRNGVSISVTVSRTPCADNMSGERFPYTVTVERAGEQLRGCGRRLG